MWSAVALALRLWGAGEASLWHDEAVELSRATAPWPTLLAGRPIDQDPPLFALLLRAWRLAGDGEAWLRALPALLGAAAVPLGWAWARRRWGPRVAATLAAFLAVAPVAVHYGQEVNQYSALPALFIALAAAWDRLAGGASDGDWRRLTALCLAGMAWHYGWAFPAGAVTLLALARARATPPAWRPGLRRHIVALAAAMMALLALGLLARLATPHLQPRLMGTGPIKELDYLLDGLWRNVLVFLLAPFSGGPALGWVAGAGVLAAWGMAALWRGDLDAREGAGRRALGLGRTSFALVYGADVAGLYPLGHRWALFGLPLLLLGLAAGVERLWRAGPWLGRAAAAAVLAGMALLAPQLDGRAPYLAVPREAMRPAVLAMAARFRPGDGVRVVPGAQPAFEHYRNAALADVGPWPSADGDLWVVLARPEPGEAEALAAELGGVGWSRRERWVWPGVVVERWVGAVERGDLAQRGLGKVDIVARGIGPARPALCERRARRRINSRGFASMHAAPFAEGPPGWPDPASNNINLPKPPLR